MSFVFYFTKDHSSKDNFSGNKIAEKNLGLKIFQILVGVIVSFQ